MGDWDIGFAMVAARLATSEIGREQETPKEPGRRALGQKRGRGQENRRSPLSGVKMVVIKGKLFLVPSVEPPKQKSAGAGEIVPSPEGW
ncbi:MAG: hypothetical protein JSV28_00390 [Deltaproteobacteria bacterium]|nr:MAG: hypothetical protein JSV28_00390 [Deltaproteobacteria bacterium]